MDAQLAIDAHGQRLISLSDTPEPVGDHLDGVPCPLSLVVVALSSKVLFGLNRWRDEWELPGGVIDPGETPRQAASRELEEETGVMVEPDELEWIGLATYDLLKPARRELAAAYRANFVDDPSIHASDVLIEVAWLDLNDLPSKHSALDLAVALITQNGSVR